VTLEQKLDSIEEIKSQLMRNPEGLDRFCSVLVKIFGKHYLKKLVNEELEAEMNRIFIECDTPMTTDDELANFIKHVGRPQFEPEGLQWRVFLVKNFKDTSVLVFKINHYLSDGIGTVLVAASL